MTLTRQGIFLYLEEVRGTGNCQWADADMVLCKSFVELDRFQPEINILFSRFDNGDTEFDRIVFHFWMPNIPDFAEDWCKIWCEAHQKIHDCAIFWDKNAIHIRHGLTVPSRILDRATFEKNYWAVITVTEQLIIDIDQRKQR